MNCGIDRSSRVVITSLRGSGVSPFWIHTCQSTRSCRKAYWSQSMPLIFAYPTCMAEVSDFTSSGVSPQWKRSASGKVMS